MSDIDKSQSRERYEGRALNSPAFSAAWGRVLGLALLLLSAVPSYAGGRPALDNDTSAGKFSTDLQQRAGANEIVDVIVQYRQMPARAHLQAMQDGGATIKSKLHSIRGVTMRVPVSMLAVLAKNPNVAYITPDRPIKMTANPTTEEFATAVEADVAAAQFALNGAGIGVAVIDSGIADHPDLHQANGIGPSRVVYSQSFVAGDPSTQDRYGHGTHVAGLVGGNGASSGPANGYAASYAGMAPNVNLINLRVLDQNGSGTDSQVIAAIEQAIALKNIYNIRVISMSLGRPVFESYTLDPVDQAVEAAWKAGIVVVVAAGNDGQDNSMDTEGYATIGVPGNDPAVITVGATLTQGTATRVDDAIASYSSKGPTVGDHIVKPDLVAPGNRQVSLLAAGSTLDQTYPQFEVGSVNGPPAPGSPAPPAPGPPAPGPPAPPAPAPPAPAPPAPGPPAPPAPAPPAPGPPAPPAGPAKYFCLSGTSMATPLVSGTVALMLQRNPSLTPDQVKARLMLTAWKGFAQYTQSTAISGGVYSSQYDIFTYGAGYLDVDAALNNTSLASGVALSPTAVYNASNSTVTLANTSSAAWSGTSVVWGATSLIWGNNVIWGASTITGTSVVWGSTSVVWGAKSFAGFSVVWGAKSIADSTMGSLSAGDIGDF
jgi:serine protease AprX